MKRVKMILTIIAIGLFVWLVGTAGDLDHHEYIEANSTPVVRLP